MGATGERVRRSEGGQMGTKHIVFRVPTTSKGAMGSKRVRRAKGSEDMLY